MDDLPAQPASLFAAPSSLPPARASLCVLASGSSANCSVIVSRTNGTQRLCLIDLGLSPRRTERLLADLGLGFHQIDDVVITHLDHDHFHPAWPLRLPEHVRIRVHQSHADGPRGHAFNLFSRPASTFDSDFSLRDGTPVRTTLAPHDDEGSVVLRFDFPPCAHSPLPASLGFATDLGEVSPSALNLLASVDVLAIESNYCPNLQAASERPEFLKRRITGGAGHLSNPQCADAVQRIDPRDHVVLLHLSRDCNRPDIAAAHHEGADYALTIAAPATPTRWVDIRPRRLPNSAALSPTVRPFASAPSPAGLLP